MRSAILVSAFALGALAVPHKRDGRLVYTELDIVEKTVTVYVTETGLPPVSAAAAAVTFSAPAKHYSHSHYHHVVPSSSAVPIVPSSSAAPVESSVYVAPSSSAPAYTPPASSAVAETPKPSSTKAPTSAAVYSSAAPASSASYGIGPAHVEGDAQADITSGDEYKNMVLFHHNLHRANHSASALTWDDSLAKAAAEGAKCSNWPFKHTSAGQNMAASGPIANVSAGITDGWYNGEMPNYSPYYGVSDPTGDFESYGHFTQLVWKGTERVGCVTTNCVSSAPGMWITVCNYMPMGNVGTEYGKNVGKPTGATVGSWTD